MGNAVYSDQMVCHDTLDICKNYCDKSECVFVDKCNGMGQKFVCVAFDPRWLMTIFVISFFIVLISCSSLVACYICRTVRKSYRMQMAQNPHREVIFSNPGKIHHVEYNPPIRQF